MNVVGLEIGRACQRAKGWYQTGFYGTGCGCRNGALHGKVQFSGKTEADQGDASKFNGNVGLTGFPLTLFVMLYTN